MVHKDACVEEGELANSRLPESEELERWSQWNALATDR